MSVVFESRVFRVEVDRVTLPGGREREVAIVRHAPSVVLIPMRDDGQVLLVGQIWELPAGSVDPGESAEDAAARECEEEIVRRPARIERLASLYPTPGYCDEELIFFRVSDLREPPHGSPHKPDEDEDIHAQAFTIAEARAMVARGEIVDLKTAYGLTLV